MNKFNTFFTKHGMKIVLGLLILTYVKSCGISTEVNRIKKDIRSTENEIDTLTNSLTSIIITEERMIDLIKETPAWKTLRIEEISDKERISINAMEQKEN